MGQESQQVGRGANQVGSTSTESGIIDPNTLADRFLTGGGQILVLRSAADVDVIDAVQEDDGLRWSRVPAQPLIIEDPEGVLVREIAGPASVGDRTSCLPLEVGGEGLIVP